MPDPALGMLVLEDGNTFTGTSMGASGEWTGEVVFDTSMTGYQEIITDPSFWGQMVVFTCPHIGNVGVNAEDVESARPWLTAIVARAICEVPSNWRSQESLPSYLQRHGVPALSGVDTRRLTIVLREKGTLRGALSTTNLDPERLLAVARAAPDMSELRPVPEVTRRTIEAWTEPVPPQWAPEYGVGRAPIAGRPHVVVIDCGAKYSIMRHLVSLGARVTVVPAATTADEIMALDPDGVLVSNGPGDPEQVPEAVEAVRRLLGKVPLFGICLGQQIIGKACGGRNHKLAFGHHGGNHPVLDAATGRVAITVQNHNYNLDANSLATLPLACTHHNLYDNTVEGISHTALPVWSVQYHPEASPGPHDSLDILYHFVHSLVHPRRPGGPCPSEPI